MNNLSMKRLFFFIFILYMAISSCNAQIFHKNVSRKAEKGLFGKSPGNKKEVRINEHGAVLSAKKKQEANDRKLKKDYAKSVKKSQKRTIDIQTPEVQARMKQNKKNTEANNKTKKKKFHSGTRKAGKKYD